MVDSERDRIFGDWLAGHKGILFKVVHAYAFEHADRQDLFQEIVFQVWRSVEAFRGESSVPTWLYRVALNTAIAWTRKEDRHQRGKQPLEAVAGLLTTSSSDAPATRVEWLYRQIAQLKDVDRSVALLLLWVRLMYVRRRAQAVREQRFGDSLRDQINRQLVQLDYGATMSRLANLLGMLLLPIVCAFAMILASWRINGRSFSDVWLSVPIVFMICWSIICVGGTFWWARRRMQRKTLPRKRRLETLLQELDAP